MFQFEDYYPEDLGLQVGETGQVADFVQSTILSLCDRVAMTSRRGFLEIQLSILRKYARKPPSVKRSGGSTLNALEAILAHLDIEGKDNFLIATTDILVTHEEVYLPFSERSLYNFLLNNTTFLKWGTTYGNSRS